MHTKSYGITPKRFKNIIIHLGDFHFMKNEFNVLGSSVCSSGFEDITFQANICSTGSLNRVLACSHQSCWAVHSNIAEALERLSFKRYLSIHDKSDVMKQLVRKTFVCSEAIKKLLEIPGLIILLEGYGYFKNCVRYGHHGMTSQFWLVHYPNFMSRQHLLHSAVQLNSLLLRLHGLKAALPFFLN